MSWFKELKEQGKTMVDTLTSKESAEENATQSDRPDPTVESYRSKLTSPQKSLSESLSGVKRDSGIVINKSANVKAMEPTNEEGAYNVVDEIRAGRIILMKLDKAEGNAETILHIVYGACHYAHIKPEKVGPMMLLIDPDLKSI